MSNITTWRKNLKALAEEAYRRDQDNSRTFKYHVKKSDFDFREDIETWYDSLFMGSVISAVWSDYLNRGSILFRTDNRFYGKRLSEMEFDPIKVLDEFEKVWNTRYDVSEKFLQRYFATGQDEWSIAINLDYDFAQIHVCNDGKARRYKCAWEELETLDTEKLFE